MIIATSTILFVTNEVALAQNQPTGPDPPTDLTATAVSPTRIDLTWKPPLNNGGSPITSYRIEVKIPPDPSYNGVAFTGNVTLYSHNGLITGKTYVYHVFAINAVGTSGPSGEDVATPTSTSAPPANIPPNPPTGLNATAISPTKIKLVWNAPSSNAGPQTSGYKIERKAGSATSYSVLVANTGNRTTTYYDTGLITGTTYTYQVSAVNSVGIGNPSNEASATPTSTSAPPATPPTSPSNLNAVAASTTQINLSWNAPSSNGGSPITGYKIEVKSGSGVYSVLEANTGNVTSYSHRGLIPGTTYTYKVYAINSVGTSDPSNEASATPTKTSTPTGLTAIAVSPTQINLSWFAPTETYGQTISGYKIERKLNANTYITIVDSTGSRSTTYSMTDLETGKTYTFVVSACFTGSCTNPSNEASVTPTPTSAPPPGQTQSTPPNQPSSNTPPGPPTGLTAIAGSPPKVILSWSAPSNNGGSTIIGYKIEAKSDNGTYSVLVANTGTLTTSYSDTGLTEGKTYTYRVSAINSVGTSDPSNEASATPVIIVSTPPPVESPILPSSGKVKVANTDVSIRYDIEGGKILSMEADESTYSVHIRIEASSNGVLTMPLPRALIDAKKSQGEDDLFYVLADKKEAKFNETKRSTSRTLEISFSDDTKEITIYGTQIIPEFGTLAPLVLAMGITFLIVTASRKRKTPDFSIQR